MTFARSSAPDWRPFKDRLDRLDALFGPPVGWVARRTMGRARAALVRSWLRILEATARWLLLALAEQLRARIEAGAAPPRPAERRTDAPAPLFHDPTLNAAGALELDSRRWRGVVFRTAEPDERSAGWDDAAPWLGRTGARLRGGVPALPLALRYEALLRVAADPERFARRRLARRRPARVRVARVRRQRFTAATSLGPPARETGPRARWLDSG